MGGGKKVRVKLSKDLITLEDKKKKEDQKKEKSSSNILIDPKIIDQIKKETPKMKLITPFTLYSKYGLKYSIAKDILESLSAQGLIKTIKTGRRLDIYTAA
ncbi:MAG: hypothetical protein NZ922_05630 [Candidatus Methanomethyliaceae archaeon]|nr:hypothetical protein [Candidatus Methanomethyliaceae archaeon]